MLIKPKYYSEEDTPLAFFMLLKVLVIIWIIISVCKFFQSISMENELAIIETMVALIIYICVAIGLYKKHWSGVIALYCMYAFYILDALVAWGICVFYDISDYNIFGQVIGSIIGVLIWAIITWVYFSKRRPLFSPYKKDVYQVTESTHTTIVGEQKNKYEKYQVCIFDEETGALKKEMRFVDVIKLPPSKFSVNDTYYAIETIRDSKKVRIYYEKNKWEKQLENRL